MTYTQHTALTMSRWTADAANEGDDLESFYLCSQCTGNKVTLDWDVATQQEDGTEKMVSYLLSWLEDVSYSHGYDEICLMCDYRPSDEDEDE